METVAFTLIGRWKEPFVPEEAVFRPFDLQALKHSYNAKDNSPIRPSDAKKSFVSQTS
jgi:hypothetical protein